MINSYKINIENGLNVMNNLQNNYIFNGQKIVNNDINNFTSTAGFHNYNKINNNTNKISNKQKFNADEYFDNLMKKIKNLKSESKVEINNIDNNTLDMNESNNLNKSKEKF